MDALKSFFTGINISQSAKNALTNIKEDFQKTLQFRRDLDVDTHPNDPTILTAAISFGAQARVPFASGIVQALHMNKIGELEGNEDPPMPLTPET